MSFATESRFPSLAAAQAPVAIALAHGVSITEAARHFGLHRSTIYRWYKSDDQFRMAVFQGNNEYLLEIRDRLRSSSLRALDTIDKLLDNPSTPASVRARLSMFVLSRSDDPKRKWSLPVPDFEPRESELLDDNPLIAEDYDRLRDQDSAREPDSVEDAGCDAPQQNSETSAPSPAAAEPAGCDTLQQKKELLPAPGPEPELPEVPKLPVN